MKIARESWVLGGICVVDLATTLWLVERYGAIEANSVMRYYLHLGYVPFIAAKTLLVFGPLAVIEWARRTRPVFVRTMLRCAIVLYIGLYSSVVWRANSPVDSREEDANAAALIRWAAEPILVFDSTSAAGTVATLTSGAR